MRSTPYKALLGVLLLTSLVSVAAAVNYATTGTVKSIDRTVLVIARSAKDGGDMTFVVKPSTQRDGKIAVGAPVEVRYHEDGKTHVATAIAVHHPAKPRPAHYAP